MTVHASTPRGSEEDDGMFEDEEVKKFAATKCPQKCNFTSVAFEPGPCKDCAMPKLKAAMEAVAFGPKCSLACPRGNVSFDICMADDPPPPPCAASCSARSRSLRRRTHAGTRSRARAWAQA